MSEQAKSAQEESDRTELANEEARLRQGEFTLADFKKMIGQTRKLGPLHEILRLVPGVGIAMQTLGDIDTDKDMRRVTGIIDAMTPAERHNPSDALDENRRRRVAQGAGVSPGDVDALVAQFEPMAEMMKKMARMSMRDRIRAMQTFNYNQSRRIERDD